MPSDRFQGQFSTVTLDPESRCTCGQVSSMQICSCQKTLLSGIKACHAYPIGKTRQQVHEYQSLIGLASLRSCGL